MPLFDHLKLVKIEDLLSAARQGSIEDCLEVCERIIFDEEKLPNADAADAIVEELLAKLIESDDSREYGYTLKSKFHFDKLNQVSIKTGLDYLRKAVCS